MLTACLDESTNGPIFCVSGLLFDRRTVSTLNREWKKALQHFGVPHFHAVDCAHLRGAFQGRSRQSCDELYKQLIQILSNNARAAITVAVVPFWYPFRKDRWGYTEYTVCSYLCLQMMLAAADLLEHKQELRAFVEAGHANMKELDALVKSQRKAGWKEIDTFQFTDKNGFRGVQAADILAYEACKRLGEMAKSPSIPPARKLRKSLGAIISGIDESVNRTALLDEKIRLRFTQSLL